MSALQSTSVSTSALTMQDEKALFEVLARGGAGAVRARDRIVMAHMGLVKMVVRSYMRPGVSPEDLIQEGALGILRALESFDAGRGVRFSTYAVHWIRARIQAYLRHCRRDWAPLMSGVDPQPQQDGRNRIPRTVAVSLETPLDSESRCAEEIVPHHAPTPDVIHDELEQRRRVHRALRDATVELDDRRAEVILEHRLLSHDPDTLAEVAKRLKLSREGARIIEQRILKSARRRVEHAEVAHAA